MREITRVLVFMVFILILSGKSVFAVVVASLPDGEDKSVVIETSFYSSVDLTIPENMDIRNPGIFQNSGILYFTNKIPTQLFLASGNLGAGKFVFAGTADCNLTIPSLQARVGKLQMNMTGGMVNLSGELAIDEKMELKSGIIDVKSNSKLLIDNESSDAVTFADSPINKGYIHGFLTRKVSSGEKYLFPVGDAASFHPFMIGQPTSDDVMSVAFDAEVPDEIRSYLPASDNAIESSIGWRVKSDLAEQNTFLAGLSFLNTSFEKNASQLEVYSFSDIDMNGSPVASMAKRPYIEANDYRSSGLYAFGKVLGVELVNFIYVASGNQTTFEIPDKDKYTNINLKVYNQLGNLVFEKDNYSSDFDARNFPEGTYFYTLILEGNEKRYKIRNFIDIRHEK
jgi:hypothetical protein